MGVKRIDPERAQELLESSQSFTYVDVRTPNEFDEGHVPTAKNVPVMLRGKDGIGIHMNQTFVSDMESRFRKSDKIILGCRKGGRSMKAADLLSEAGFTNLYDMRGGLVGETDPFGNILFPGWQTRGLPVTRDARKDDHYQGV
ncbi:MAG: rhodanese-like domain-containing protein [Planctomycetes bacterium]|nr:rhodanese-like domain-containing protein [Planctomycetota bacterium]